MSALVKLEERQRDAIERGLCKCLCGRPRSSHSLYADYGRCRQRAYRLKLDAEASDRGVQTSTTLARLREHPHGTAGPGSRNGDAQIDRKRPRRRNRSDVRIGLPRLERAARELLGETQTRRLLDLVLTEQQRKAAGR